ncbi:ESPR domain-containing protein [Cupriavidus sp. CP313]
MNQNRYRLVFNKQRGMLMAVPECANGAHKAASGERAGGTGRSFLATLRPIAWALLLSTGYVQLAGAQIVSDPRAGHGPAVTTAPNGTPLVGISSPSAPHRPARSIWPTPLLPPARG